MTEIRTRLQWGARATRGTGNAISGHPAGAAVHYEGPAMGTKPHSECDGIVRGIQVFHQDTRGWADIAYNHLVCPHDVLYEGRGYTRGSAANGTTQANLDYFAVCAIIGSGDPLTPGLIAGLQTAASLYRQHGAGDSVVGHRDLFATACPGDLLYAEVRKGTFGQHALPVHPAQDPATKPIYPASPTPVAASGAPRFPLDQGWYFGPSTGPKCSVSGYYGHSAELALWQAQMAKRGWKITADGHYGPQTAAVAGAFQSQKGLKPVDRLIGAGTWTAAWTASVTKG